ncbi:hypothetical protein AV530_001196 [Patagioenas fasciata monilis]|uniref:Uncharacterized protein n=1 Tax=Patagioenas fasciata monilis TaxID=372326 RepID=A0A1V4KTM2_PATFA|nr:hypothetical protein AV530_001196 [Patagioenas fasciata monilis]
MDMVLSEKGAGLQVVLGRFRKLNAEGAERNGPGLQQGSAPAWWCQTYTEVYNTLTRLHMPGPCSCKQNKTPRLPS